MRELGLNQVSERIRVEIAASEADPIVACASKSCRAGRNSERQAMQRASGLARLAERGCTARLATRILRRSSTQPASQLKFRPPATAFAPLEAARESDLPTYQNVDGMRHDDGRYSAFKADVRAMLGDDRVVDDPVRTFAYGTDASFYRLTPQAVVKVCEMPGTLTPAHLCVLPSC